MDIRIRISEIFWGRFLLNFSLLSFLLIFFVSIICWTYFQNLLNKQVIVFKIFLVPILKRSQLFEQNIKYFGIDPVFENSRDLSPLIVPVLEMMTDGIQKEIVDSLIFDIIECPLRIVGTKKQIDL